MANHQNSSGAAIKIPEALNEENVTLYLISITVGTVYWTVKHRYNDFVELHESLLEEGIEKDVLPPKKLIGNKEPSFIMKRRRELESYLQSVFHFLERNLPQSLADFLDLPLYDIHYILRGLASNIYDRENREDAEGENEAKENQCEWSPLELHAVSERLKSPCPPQDIESKRYDFTNVADFCCQLSILHITGDEASVGTSNIIPNHLEYDFLAFKSLKTLHLSQVKISPDRLTSLGILRQTLTSLQVTDCDLEAVSALLLCDVVHSSEDLASLSKTKSLSWPELRQLDLSRNKLEAIDESLRLAPGLTSLDLSYNVITGLSNLTCLPHLSRLKMCHNKVKVVEEVHVKLGQVQHVDLSNNKLKSLAGFAKLYSLVRLDVSNNKLKELEQVLPVCSLPCLEFLDTSNNKVTDVVDYKLKVLERAGSRAGEMLVDKEATTQADMDKVSVLMALRVAKEGKSPTALFGNLPTKVL